MVNPVNYRGNFMQELYKAFEENREMQIGEILYSFLHKEFLNGKHFFYAEDKEIHDALERFNRFGIEEDEPLDEQAFSFWVEQQTVIKDK